VPSLHGLQTKLEFETLVKLCLLTTPEIITSFRVLENKWLVTFKSSLKNTLTYNEFIDSKLMVERENDVKESNSNHLLGVKTVLPRTLVQFKSSFTPVIY